MGSRCVSSLDLDEALSADRLITASRGVDVGRVVLRAKAEVGSELVSLREAKDEIRACFTGERTHEEAAVSSDGREGSKPGSKRGGRRVQVESVTSYGSKSIILLLKPSERGGERRSGEANPPPRLLSPPPPSSSSFTPTLYAHANTLTEGTRPPLPCTSWRPSFRPRPPAPSWARRLRQTPGRRRPSAGRPWSQPRPDSP